MKIEWASDFHRDGSRRSHPIASTMHGWLAKMRGTLVGNEKLRSEGMREMRQAKANRKHRKQNKSQGKSPARRGGFSLFGSGRKPAPQHRGSRNVTRGGHGGGEVARAGTQVGWPLNSALSTAASKLHAVTRFAPVAAQHHKSTLRHLALYDTCLLINELFLTDCAGAEHILAGPNMPYEYQTIPATIIWFHYISLLTSFAIVVMSIFDYGTLSLYMNPLIGLLTIFFHASLIILTHKRPELKGMLSVEAVVFAYLLSLSWLACFVVMVYVAWKSQGRSSQLFGMDEAFLTVIDNATQRLQLMCTSLEFGLLGDLAVRSTWARRSEFEDCGCHIWATINGNGGCNIRED
ncbi:hypothetical protein EV359DRAFT_80561 [Lentinula novae-zelandiae]|nr:hypothetical protein EV359DRAFT_80561 [Lentinula novae-zelandiae]